MGDLKTLCIFLGPLGNLTTLTAGALALHPNCLIVNHGARYLWEARGCNFLVDWTEENVAKFVREAVDVSRKNSTSAHSGGSILVSHVFNSDPIKKLYIERYGSQIIHDDIECLVWKDPMALENYLMEYSILPGGLFEKDDGLLRFIMPIRHPMDVAVSLMSTGNWSEYRNLEYRFSNTVHKVLYNILRFVNLQRQYPGRCFYFVQDEVNRRTLLNLAAFLRLEPEERWIDNVISVWDVRESYTTPLESTMWYEVMVKLVFYEYPEMVERLVRMAQHDGQRPFPSNIMS